MCTLNAGHLCHPSTSGHHRADMGIWTTVLKWLWEHKRIPRMNKRKDLALVWDVAESGPVEFGNLLVRPVVGL